MNKREFLAVLQSERADFERVLNGVEPDRMKIPGVSGDYSIKDILAHLEAYDRALVVWLENARAGQVYVDPVLDGPDLDARNAVVYAAHRDKSAAEITASFRQTLDELESAIKALTEEELLNADLTAWFVVPRWQTKRELYRCIANDSYEHHRQHLPDIEQWLEQQDCVSVPHRKL